MEYIAYNKVVFGTQELMSVYNIEFNSIPKYKK